MATKAASAFVEIEPKLSDNFRGDVERSIAPVTQSLSDRFSSVGRSLRQVGAQATAFVSIPIAGAFYGAFNAASDLNESLSKSNTIFGANAKQIENWASTAAQNFGQSKRAALDAAGSFGNLFQQVGIGGNQAALMSRSLVELASDFASFHNANPAEVIEAQTAAFRGEYDALQRFVPTINAAAVEQRALADTGKSAAKELTAGEKAAATYALMMEGAGQAIGDFDRTSDGAANQQRILKARFEDVAATLGTQLLPIGTRILEWVSGLADRFSQLDPGIQTAILAIAGLAAVAGPLAFIIGGVASALGLILSPVGLIVLAIAGLVAGFVYAYNEFETFRDLVDSVWQALQDGAQAAYDFLAPIVQEIAGYIVEKWTEIVEWTREIWPQVQEAVEHVFSFFESLFGPVLDVLGQLWSSWGDNLAQAALAVWGLIQTYVDFGIRAVQSIIQIVLAVINGDWSAAWDGIKSLVGAAWDFIVGIVSNGATLIGAVLGAAMELLGAIFSTGWEYAKQITTDALSAIGDAVGQIPGIVGGIASSVYNAALDVGGKILSGIADGVSGAVGVLADIGTAVYNAVARSVNSIIDKVNDALEFEISAGPVSFSVDPPDIPTIPTRHGGGLLPGLIDAEALFLGRAGEMVLNRRQQTELFNAINSGNLGGARGRTVEIGQLVVQSDAPPREWIDESLWRVAG